MADSMPIRIAYLGAGNMAQGMIRRLLGAGFDVTVWNRTPEKVVPLEASGARRAATPRAAAEGATLVMASVIDDEASRSVWLGPDGALQAGGPTARIAVEHSTLSHDWVMELSGLVRQRGWRYVDCPVAGRPNMSAAGELVVFAGADPRDLDEIRPVLKPMSKEIFHFGPPGSGTAFKLIYNLMGATQVAALAEGLVAAEAVGLDLRTAARAFSTGATGSPHVVRHAAFMAEGKHEDPPAFTGRGRLKDSLYGVQIANKHGIDVRIGQSTATIFQEMVDGGLAAAADSRVIDVIRRRSGKPAGERTGERTGEKRP